MLRPDPEQTLFGHIPVRLIVALILLFAVVLTIALILGIEHERSIIQSMVKISEVPSENLLGFIKIREDLIKMAIILFLLGGIGISVIVTHQHYHATKRTLEQVKSLARNILKSIPSGILTVDRRGMITAINPVAEQILHVSSTQALGQAYLNLFSEGDPVRETLTQALEKRDLIRDQDIMYNVGAAQQIAIRVTVSELKDDQQEYAGVVLSLKDVSEFLVLEQQLRRSEKLSALHTLSAGVAHEIRNPLSAVDLNLHLLEEELVHKERADTAVKKYLEILDLEVERLKDILDNFMRFSRPLSLKLGQVSLTEVLQHILKLMEYEAHDKKIRCEVDIPEELPLVRGDETELSQVFLNIIINAIQAMSQGGVVRVSAGITGDQLNRAVEVRISDTGIGIPKKDLPKLFEPFYTTKEYGGGLGLPIAYRIVEDHGGSIHIESQEGVGTTVTIRLPCSTDRVKEAEQVE